jgi:hypothetical protein
MTNWLKHDESKPEAQAKDSSAFSFACVSGLDFACASGFSFACASGFDYLTQQNTCCFETLVAR